MSSGIPFLAGLMTRPDVLATAAAIAATQERDGAIPWSVGAETDVWNHVEAAMALLVGGRPRAAARAYDWCLGTQRPDGSWPMRFRGGQVVDAGVETNMCAYLAVGVWHHWLVCRDPVFLRRCWPAVRRALDLVTTLQLPFGGVAWARGDDRALLAGSASIFHALRAGLALAEVMDDPQPEWELVSGRLGHALRHHRDAFLDKSAFSMDWYYPVLGGAVRGERGRELLRSRWADFVVPGLGIHCVRSEPWVTGAETCELALALDAVGDRPSALALLRDMQHLRAEDGAYWTGYVYPDEARWPVEQTTYTSAAVILAVDALSRTTPGSDLFRGDRLPRELPELALECGCADAPARERAR